MFTRLLFLVNASLTDGLRIKMIRRTFIVLSTIKSKFIIFLFFMFQIWNLKISYRRSACLSSLFPSTPYQYRSSKKKFSLFQESLKNLLNRSSSDEVTAHRRNKCRKVSRLDLSLSIPLHKKHSSLKEGNR
jgi:hypothetical protein